MKKVIVYYSAIIILIFSSCYSYNPPKRVKTAFKSYCYCNEQYTGIDTLINIDGYFVQEMSAGVIKGTNEYMLHKDPNYFMFYKDGMFVKITSIGSHDPVFYLQSVSRNEENEAEQFFYENYWGRYDIKGDTITVLYINPPPGLPHIWYKWERQYKIIDKNTLMPIIPIDSSKNEYENDIPSFLYAAFVPLEERPSSDGWIKNKKWLRCNE